MNHMYSRANTPEPVVGGGATVLYWTDRKAATIVRVTKTQVHIQLDIAVRTDVNGMSECQDYNYFPSPEAVVDIFRKTKRGWRNKAGNTLVIGYRETYYDYSF